ncbi:unnamed protein product [Hyaloperonospora brassicae]|uniref:Saccharopine dehydrogenase NADP binding domain-containing protein n=1 Tax=Hyaloperonospora brassicae TaxID=162125 RepID=A0AAV0UV50_HYABA|nr:unnamed protein product [Hyaloperonospora brassicae]
MKEKRFDVIVYGATGFAGVLVARYLASESESSLGSPTAVKWAIAARNATKLTQVKEKLKPKLPEVDPSLIDAIPVVVADSSNEESLVQMVQQTKVVVSLVGPYKLHGELLIKACAENGVHYCDISGETVWINEMMASYGSAAAKSGAVLVNFCGFGSVPSDLTTDVDDEAATSFVQPFFLTDEKTIAEKKAAGLIEPNTTGILVRYDKTMRTWHSLFTASVVDQAVVHRSNYLLQNKYGRNFVYHGRRAIGGLLMQALATVGTLLGLTMLYFSWTRALIKRLVQAPGQGPSEETMFQGYFVADAVGYSEDGKSAARAKVVGSGGDPGYRLTSRLVAECALCLAKDEFGESSHLEGGFYTPASAFGHKLADRLQKKKLITFELKDAE